MDERSYACAELVERILVGGYYKSVKFINDKLTVKATRKRYKGKVKQNEKQTQILLTIGPPNYEERDALKKAKKEGLVLTFRSKFPKTK